MMADQQNGGAAGRENVQHNTQPLLKSGVSSFDGGPMAGDAQRSSQPADVRLKSMKLVL